ncbi:putative membrane protein [Candidatus Protofrankia californiensis]|uniref:Putative membrane protein n=1 Tax=Candidatus Protofrankia californiensis TaxID=1839754 RepID=A0A1C3PFZ5_9ACTN|nr:putative membrane protein [Candidatus Protofrankia californiensis]
MASGAVPTRAMARLVLVYMALAGLFVMHGVAAGLGCPGGTGTSGSAMAVHGSATGHAASTALRMPVPVSMSGHEASAVPPPATVVTGDVSSVGGHGVLCVSSPPRQELAGLLILLLAVGAVALAWPAWPWNAGAHRGGSRRRAPPLAGSCLLVRVCVSRT